MKVLYLHGYGSKFDPDSAKMQTLKKRGKVSGPDLDYGRGQQAVVDAVLTFVDNENYDLIVGTSMGGWLASHASVLLRVPFVALNPAIRPSQTLQKYIGQTINYVGYDCLIDDQAVISYEDFQTQGGYGHILCEEGDEVLDAHETISHLKAYYGTTLVPAGSHRFESLKYHLDQLDQTASIGAKIMASEVNR
ncbi:Uncharacterised protein [Halioglobus japonicus]|nr:Uncharacterised protein [Halioglobus japonicus]